MYTICAIAPVFLVQALYVFVPFLPPPFFSSLVPPSFMSLLPEESANIRTMSSSLSPAAKIVILTSEAGSVTLRTEGEGGGMYGHHGSKAAGNMIGHLLGYDLKERGIPIAMIHVRLFLFLTLLLPFPLFRLCIFNFLTRPFFDVLC